MKYVPYPITVHSTLSFLPSFPEFYSVCCAMVLALRALTSHGQNQPENLGPQLSSLHVVTATLYVPLLPSKITLMSILLSHPPRLFSLTILHLVNRKISLNTNSLTLSPTSGLPPCAPMSWATVSVLAGLLSYSLQESLPKSLPPPGVGPPSPSYSIGAAWTKSCPCPPQKLTIKHISIVLPLFLKNSVLITKSLHLYLIIHLFDPFM